MREWVAREDKQKKRLEERNEGEKVAKRVRVMQEREDTEEDKAMQEMNRDLFGEELSDNKRKEDKEDKGAPEGKRRRTQEEED
eukprot:11034135-Karenia_brevis.AAC.1